MANDEYKSTRKPRGRGASAPFDIEGLSTAEIEDIYAVIQSQMPSVVDEQFDPFIGNYGVGVASDPSDLRGEIYYSDVFNVISQLSDVDKDYLAMEMHGANVYDDINDMYDDNYQRNEKFFNNSVLRTIELAEQGGKLGFDTTFLNILMSANKKEGRLDVPSLMQQLAKAKAGSGDGRGYQPYNTNALIKSLKDESSNTLGRIATNKEQQAFVRRIHNMQAAGQHISVPAEAEAFARQSDPNLAGAMDRAGAASAVMRVLGIGGGR